MTRSVTWSNLSIDQLEVMIRLALNAEEVYDAAGQAPFWSSWCFVIALGNCVSEHDAVPGG